MAKINGGRLFIVGAAKCGTTSLVSYIGQHPEIFCPEFKEPCYFVDGIGCNKFEYMDLYKGRRERIVVDASTPYLFEERCAEKIYEFDPAAKIVIMLRDPVNMAYSLWQYMVAIGNEKQTFLNAVKNNDDRVANARFNAASSGWEADYWYLSRARYHDQVKRYLQVFPRENIKIILFEDFIHESSRICEDVVGWLGLPSWNFDVSSVVNEGGSARFSFINTLRSRRYPLLKKLFPAEIREKIRRFTKEVNMLRGDKTPLSEEDRATLQELFREDVCKLKQLIGVDVARVWGGYEL